MPEFRGAVIASKLRDGNEQIGSHVGVDLPSIAFATQEYKGSGLMGPLTLPSSGQIEHMEVKLNLRGSGEGRARLMQPGTHKLGLFFGEDSLSVQRGVIRVGCKIYMDAIFVSADGGTVENGSPREGSITMAVTRYQEIVDGKEELLVDKLSNIYRINGVDHMADINSMLE